MIGSRRELWASGFGSQEECTYSLNFNTPKARRAVETCLPKMMIPDGAKSISISGKLDYALGIVNNAFNLLTTSEAGIEPV